jgi:hypothetical protein
MKRDSGMKDRDERSIFVLSSSLFPSEYKQVKTEGWTCHVSVSVSFVYYESIKSEVNTRPIYECRCDERLSDDFIKTKLLFIEVQREEEMSH